MYNLRFITISVPKCTSFNLSKFTERFGSFQPLHTTSISLQTTETNDPPQEERKYKKPVDWLPFKWHRRRRFNIFQQSGDTIFENTVDPTLPKPDFELSDELKSASPEVKELFSLRTGTKVDMKEVAKRHLLKRVQRHPNDYESLEVKIALMTIQVRGLFQHRKDTPKQEVRISRVILPIMIQKRNKLLQQLRLMDEERFQWILNELNLYFIPPQLNPMPQRYCKKWDLRRLTKEYCEHQIAAKKDAYHEELQREQEAFLEEKKQALAWMEEEEKAIKALSSKINARCNEAF